MTDLYKKASEMVLQYLEGHRSDFVGHEPKTGLFPYDQVCKTQPLIREIVAAVEDELNYELSEFQCSWAIQTHYRFGLEAYGKANEPELKPLVLVE